MSEAKFTTDIHWHNPRWEYKSTCRSLCTTCANRLVEPLIEKIDKQHREVGFTSVCGKGLIPLGSKCEGYLKMTVRKL